MIVDLRSQRAHHLRHLVLALLLRGPAELPELHRATEAHFGRVSRDALVVTLGALEMFDRVVYTPGIGYRFPGPGEPGLIAEWRDRQAKSDRPRPRIRGRCSTTTSPQNGCDHDPPV